jgi:hypothetical protein
LKIVSIFADGIIWSIKGNDDKDNRFRTLLSQWRDLFYLDNFFDEHWELVEKSRVWKKYSKDSLILQVRIEAQNILKVFKDEYIKYKEGNVFEIGKMFEVLEGTHLPLCLKAYGNYNQSHRRGKPAILRLYAIETADHHLVITGGGIKLTDSMDDCDYLKEELKKLRRIRKTFEDRGIDCLNEVEIEI